MENMKMSDVWNKPLTFSIYDSATVSGFTISNGFGVLFSNVEPAKAVCYAVNNHDRLVEENAELREILSAIVHNFSDEDCSGLQYENLWWAKQLLNK